MQGSTGRSGVGVLAPPDPWQVGLPDDQLLALARSGDDDALSQLLLRYRSLARNRARSYFLAGADREDMAQEAMIGLYKAVRDFDPERETSFRAFAELCVTRQVLTAVKTATRNKHSPLNNYVSFTGTAQNSDLPFEEPPGVAASDPAELLVSAERLRGLQELVDEALSGLETQVLRLWVDGRSYQEIAELLERQVKSIDNALQRVKKKLECHLRERAEADAADV